jgi:hypothetical protein
MTLRALCDVLCQTPIVRGRVDDLAGLIPQAGGLAYTFSRLIRLCDAIHAYPNLIDLSSSEKPHIFVDIPRSPSTVSINDGGLFRRGLRAPHRGNRHAPAEWCSDLSQSYG